MSDLGMPFVHCSDGMRLWINPKKCPHYNDNACATCDFDRYYANKYLGACPWYKEAT